MTGNICVAWSGIMSDLDCASGPENWSVHRLALCLYSAHTASTTRRTGDLPSGRGSQPSGISASRGVARINAGDATASNAYRQPPRGAVGVKGRASAERSELALEADGSTG